MKRLLSLLFIMSSIQAMEPAGPAPVDANGYRYRDENTTQDKRKIAVLSYGSLVNQVANRQTGARLEATPFKPTDTMLPVSLMRLSSGNRITAVIDRQGDPKRAWAATSQFQWLPNARNNLAAREGSPYRGPEAGYDLNNIFYMKKLLPGRIKDNNEAAVPGTNWVIRIESNERQQLPVEAAQQLVRWADANGYSAIIWASFPPNISSRAVVIQKLLGNDELLRNTQDYVRQLPDGPQTPFERAIMAGDQALRNFGSQAPAAAPAPAPAQQPAQQVDTERRYENFSYYQRGDLPILLSAPHGGVKRIPDIPNREGRNAGREQFVTVWDDGTLELAQEVSDEIYRLLGKRPYLIAADFTRKQIDANRSAQGAYEVPAAKPYYDFYQGKLAEYVRDIKNRFGDRAILIDIHGQGTDAKTVYRGTRDRTTVRKLIHRDGEAAFTGPNSILGMLQQQDNTIYPKNADTRVPEKGMYSGGYIVGHYGSNNADGIDALQLENGWDLRRGNGLPRFAKELAQAIAQFYGSYLAR